MKIVDSLPLEVIDCIVHFTDEPTVKVFALTSRRYLHSCQSHLFRYIHLDAPILNFSTNRFTISKAKAKKFYKLLLESSHLAAHVRTLRISENVRELDNFQHAVKWLKDDKILHLLTPLLVRLERLELSDLFWVKMKESTRAGIFSAFQLKSLRFVSLSSMPAFPWDSLQFLDHAELIEVLDMGPQSSDFFQSIVIRPENLPVLHLDITNTFGRFVADGILDRSAQYGFRGIQNIRELHIKITERPGSLTNAMARPAVQNLIDSACHTLKHAKIVNIRDDLVQGINEKHIPLSFQANCSLESLYLCVHISEDGHPAQFSWLSNTLGSIPLPNLLTSLTLHFVCTVSKDRLISPSLGWKQLEELLLGGKFKNLRHLRLLFGLEYRLWDSMESIKTAVAGHLSHLHEVKSLTIERIFLRPPELGGS